MRVLGKMLVFEGCFAGGMWLLAKLAPELKQRAESAAKAQLEDLSPELAQQLEEVSQ